MKSVLVIFFPLNFFIESVQAVNDPQSPASQEMYQVSILFTSVSGEKFLDKFWTSLFKATTLRPGGMRSHDP
jgi:hypothetical protein